MALLCEHLSDLLLLSYYYEDMKVVYSLERAFPVKISLLFCLRWTPHVFEHQLGLILAFLLTFFGSKKFWEDYSLLSYTKKCFRFFFVERLDVYHRFVIMGVVRRIY